VQGLEERAVAQVEAARLQHAMDLAHHQLRVGDVLRQSGRVDGVEDLVSEGQEVRVAEVVRPAESLQTFIDARLEMSVPTY
jgi:hypothetical protein